MEFRRVLFRSLTLVRCADISLSRRREGGGARQEGREVRLHRAWTHAGAAATVRDAEGLVQVEVRDVRTPLAGPGDADQGVHVGAVGVYLPAVLVHDLADLDHVLLDRKST